MRGLPRKKDLIIRPNQAGQLVCSWADRNGVPIALTSYGIRAMVRGSYADIAPLLTFGVGSGITVGTGTPYPTNVFVLAWTAAQANTVVKAWARGLWDLYLDPSGTPDSTSIYTLKGDVFVQETVVR